MNTVKSAVIQLMKALPQSTRRRIANLGFNLEPEHFRYLAYQYAMAPDMLLSLQSVCRRGYLPKIVLDVGAFKGGWTRLAMKTWPSAHYHLFEPNAAMHSELVDLATEENVKVHAELLGPEDGKAIPFYVMGSGSSILPENSPVRRKEESRTMRRLDRLISLPVDAAALLKIDAQGYELEILKGATGILPFVDAILLEISLIEINKGAPLFHEVVAQLDSLGFSACDIVEIHRRPLDGATNQVDLLFVKHDSFLFKDKRHWA